MAQCFYGDPIPCRSAPALDVYGRGQPIAAARLPGIEPSAHAEGRPAAPRPTDDSSSAPIDLPTRSAAAPDNGVAPASKPSSLGATSLLTRELSKSSLRQLHGDSPPVDSAGLMPRSNDAWPDAKHSSVSLAQALQKRALGPNHDVQGFNKALQSLQQQRQQQMLQQTPEDRRQISAMQSLESGKQQQQDWPMSQADNTQSAGPLAPAAFNKRASAAEQFNTEAGTQSSQESRYAQVKPSEHEFPVPQGHAGNRGNHCSRPLPEPAASRGAALSTGDGARTAPASEPATPCASFSANASQTLSTAMKVDSTATRTGGESGLPDLPLAQSPELSPPALGDPREPSSQSSSCAGGIASQVMAV